MNQAVRNQLIQDTGYSSIQMGAQQPITSMDPKVVASELQLAKAELAAARRGGDTASIPALTKRAQDLARRKAMLDNPDMDPLSVAALADNEAGTIAAGNEGAGGSAARRAAKGAAGDARSRVQALQRQVDVAMTNMAPQEQLQRLLDQWKAAKEEEITQQSTADSGDTAQRLADFRFEAKEYFDKVLNGNIQAAKDMIARADEQAAQDTSGREAVKLLSGGGNLTDSLEEIQEAWAKAFESAIDAADQEMRSKGGDVNARPAIEKRQQIQRDFIGKTIEATLKAIDDYFSAESRRIDQEASTQGRQIASARSRLSILNNYYGSRQVGDVRRGLAERQSQMLDEEEARGNVSTSRQRYMLGLQRQAVLQDQLDTTVDPAARTVLSQDLSEAANNVATLADELEAAQNSLTEIAGIAPELTNFTDAWTTAWTYFRQQSELTKGMYENVADGLFKTFETAKSGMKGLVVDVFTGTKSMGAAFKDFTLSVLDSMMDMAAEILSKQILMSVINFAQGRGWVPSMQLGGEVPGLRRMALGGDPAPFRDGVTINAMPGEVLMRKSAVDMVGRDNLLAMNALGNTRLSAMPTIAQAMPQRPGDEVNVWVVDREQAPPPGKKDIVAAVGQDILTGGETKQLIKKVITGAL